MRTFLAFAAVSAALAGSLASVASAQTRSVGGRDLQFSQPYAQCSVDEGYGRMSNCHQGGGGS